MSKYNLTNGSEDMDDLTLGNDQEHGAVNVLTVHNVLASATFDTPGKLDLDKVCLTLGNSYYQQGGGFPAARIEVRGRGNAVYTISMFDCGKVQSTGGNEPAGARRAMLKIAKKLTRAFGRPVVLERFEVQNILAVYDAGHCISLPSLVAAYPRTVEYEPERFPAARLKIPMAKFFNQSKEAAPSAPDATATAAKRVLELMLSESSRKKLEVRAPNAGDKRPLGDSKEPGNANMKEETVTANVFSTGKITFTGAKSMRSLWVALDTILPYISETGSYLDFSKPIQVPKASSIQTPLGVPFDCLQSSTTDNAAGTPAATLAAKLQTSLLSTQAFASEGSYNPMQQLAASSNSWNVSQQLYSQVQQLQHQVLPQPAIQVQQVPSNNGMYYGLRESQRHGVALQAETALNTQWIGQTLS